MILINKMYYGILVIVHVLFAINYPYNSKYMVENNSHSNIIYQRECKISYDIPEGMRIDKELTSVLRIEAFIIGQIYECSEPCISIIYLNKTGEDQYSNVENYYKYYLKEAKERECKEYIIEAWYPVDIGYKIMPIKSVCIKYYYHDGKCSSTYTIMKECINGIYIIKISMLGNGSIINKRYKKFIKSIKIE